MSLLTYFTNILVLIQLLLEDVLSHSSVLDVISMKGSNMAEHYVTQLEIQDLQERYNIVKDKAQV